MKNQLLNLKMIALMCLMMVLGGANVWAEEEVISLANGSFAKDQITWTGTSCSIIQSKGTSSTPPKSDYVNAPRWYQSHVVSFEAKKGYKIDGAIITSQNSKDKPNPKGLANSNYTNATATVNGNLVEIKASGDFKIVLGEQCRIKNITILYTNLNPASPTLVSSESALDFGAVENNTSKDLSFKLSGSKLTAGATLSVAGDYFTVTPTSVAQTDGTIAEKDVTVSFKPTAVGSHTATLTISSTGAKDKTITLTGTSANAYNVAWNVNGNVYTDGTPTTKVVDGEKVTVLPTTPKDINGKVFVGWTNASLSVAQDAAPSVLFTDAAYAPKVTGDVTYYAVFANRTDGGEVTYTKLTSNKFKTNATYVIGAEQSATNNTIWYFKGVVNKNWGKMTSNPSVESPIAFTLSGSASALVVKGDNEKYLSSASSTGNFPEMSSEETKVILGIDGTIKTLDETLSLRHNYNSAGGGLRWYSGNTGESAYFYEVNEGYIYSGYCTTVEAAAEPTYTKQTPLTFRAEDNGYYATFSNDKVTFITSDNSEAYKIVVSDGNIVKTKFDEVSADINGKTVKGFYIPANTGILLYSIAETADYYTVENKTVDAISPVDNMLEPAPKDGGIFAFNEGYKYYKLAYNDYTNRTGLGFYWGANNGGAFYVKGGTAYLKVLAAKAASAKGFAFNGEATGIEGVNANVENAKAIYNLNGQRVASMAKPGLYIVNGKKVVRK